MIAQSSAIKLKHFAVLQSQYEFTQLQKKVKDVQKVFEVYEIDIDFAHHHDNKDDSIHVFVKIGVNRNPKSLPGYKLFAEGAGIFKLNEAG